MVTKTIDQIGDEDWTEELANAAGAQVTLYNSRHEEKVQKSLKTQCYLPGDLLVAVN